MVAEKDIVHYLSLDLPPSLKVFTGLSNNKIHISPFVSQSKNLAVLEGIFNFFIFSIFFMGFLMTYEFFGNVFIRYSYAFYMLIIVILLQHLLNLLTSY